MLKDWTYVTKLLPHLFIIHKDMREKFIRNKKEQMLCTMLEEHPARAYEAICFEIESDKGEIYEGIEDYFKMADGQYIYKGEFVSREFLWKRFENLPCRIKMTAYVREEDLDDE